MKIDQRDIFLSSEGDKWFERNKQVYSETHEDKVIDFIKAQELTPKRVLEIGCASGLRLHSLYKEFGSDGYGVDPSSFAIETGKKNYPHLHLSVATADSIDFEKDSFDFVILGFCLYLCDREDLFTIAAKVDKVLKNGGYIIIQDFLPPYPYKNKYSHCEGLYSYKFDHSRMFTWNPLYSTLATDISTHSARELRTDVDERVGISLLYKQIDDAYPNKQK
ncbi:MULTISPECIES: class I SAM-dependent methyltransferase [Pseudoalteromonas]|uniref:class I SAM-dependent methyltransferase n=1 Tax=Pseudoalteromonas TaxID=53246 RepID=UPI00026C99BE|nr:class I SAM-dependent methyltransferase [Pseudoalteromonas spongiae]ATC98057.1 hypothetical protein PSPO_a0898 [Pseudoalteromonas spongiae UST010723-006]